jgi:hypothetical protein
MTTKLEALYARLDRVHMTEADRHMAKVHLARAEALANFFHGALARLSRIVRARSVQASRRSDLQARGSS